MAGLQHLFTRLDLRDPLPQPCKAQGAPYFHQFLELPSEIRTLIWKFSFPSARSIRVRPLVPKDRSLVLLDHGRKCAGVLDIGFCYEDNNSIAALRTVSESRKAAQLFYQCLVTNGQTTYFCPYRDTLLFIGFETIFGTLVNNAWRPATIIQVLRNTCDHEARRFADSINVKWLAPVLERSAHIKRQQPPGGQTSFDSVRRNKAKRPAKTRRALTFARIRVRMPRYALPNTAAPRGQYNKYSVMVDINTTPGYL